MDYGNLNRGYPFAPGSAYHSTIAFAIAWWLSGVTHELFHVVIAAVLGFHAKYNWENLKDIILRRQVRIDGTRGWRKEAIHHAGWMGRYSKCCKLLVHLDYVERH